MSKTVMTTVAFVGLTFAISAGAAPFLPGQGASGALLRNARVDCFDQRSGEFLHPGPCRGESRYSPGGGYGRGSGYRLYFNGQKVSGPDAPGYTRRQAEENCAWNARTKPGISIRCTYNGATFFEN